MKLRDGRRVFTWIGLTLTLWVSFAVAALALLAITFVYFVLPAISQLMS